MSDLVLQDLDPELRARLSEQARRHGRSISAEAVALIREGSGRPLERSAWDDFSDLFSPVRASGGVDLEEFPDRPLREPPEFR